MAGRLKTIAAVAVAVAAAIAIGTPAPAAAREASAMHRLATEAYEAGDIDTAVAAFAHCARAGEAACQSALGYLFLVGEGVDADEEHALDLFRRAAKQGDPYGEFSLGTMYRHGVAVERDFERARQLFVRAIAGGYAAAHAELGEMYAAGEGMPADRRLAISHLVEAGSAGIPLAMFRAGQVARGDVDDTERRPEVALELFILAAGMDFPEAMLAAGAMLQSGDGVAVDHVEALKWHLLAAGHHDSDAELRALARGAISLLDGKLSPEGRAEARARAAAWTPDRDGDARR